MQHLIRFFKDEEGVTAIEYGLIAALIIVVCAAAIGTAGTTLNTMWGTITTKLTPAS